MKLEIRPEHHTTKRPPVSPVKEDGHYHPPYRRGDVSPVYEEDHSSHADLGRHPISKGTHTSSPDNATFRSQRTHLSPSQDLARPLGRLPASFHDTGEVDSPEAPRSWHDWRTAHKAKFSGKSKAFYESEFDGHEEDNKPTKVHHTRRPAPERFEEMALTHDGVGLVYVQNGGKREKLPLLNQKKPSFLQRLFSFAPQHKPVRPGQAHHPISLLEGRKFKPVMSRGKRHPLPHEPGALLNGRKMLPVMGRPERQRLQAPH